MITELAILGLMVAGVQVPPTVDIEFRVTVPSETSADAVLYLSGSHQVLGNWQVKGVRLTRHDDGSFHAKVALPRDVTVEYKVTQGSWATVEKDANGGEISNRELLVKEATTVHVEVAAWATLSDVAESARAPTRTGDIRFHEKFKSRHLKNERTLVVYLPPGYEGDTKRHPVFYMHDGQNLFDASTSFIGVEWQADEHAERLIRAGRIQPIIIVGIYNNAERISEYTPDRDEHHGSGGQGSAYAKFVVQEVKPFIDRTYRTKPARTHTAVAGSSAGGLISLYICARYPETFSMCGVISPMLMWNNGSMLRELEQDSSWMKRVRFWLDMGTAEGDDIGTFNSAIERTRRLARIFDEAGLLPGRDYYYQEIHGGRHNEAHWASRFDKVLLYFFGQD